MKEIFIKVIGFIFIIILGYICKKSSLVKKEDGTILANIIMNITLPAAIISGASNMKINISTLAIIMLGFFSNIILMIIAYIAERKNGELKQGIAMNNYAGYNIGNFGIPLISSFFQGSAMQYMCMFDMGSALMGLGGTYAYTKTRVDGNGKLDIKYLIKTILKSRAINIYMIVFVMGFLNINMPKEIIGVTSMIGSANGFLAMFLVGVVLDIKISKKQVGAVAKIIMNRYIGNSIIALIVYFLLPLPLLARQIIVIALFTPLSTISVVYSRMLDDNDIIPPIANSISIITSMGIMIALIIMFLN